MPTEIAVLVDLAQTNLFIIIMIINTIFFNENLLGPCLAQPRRISSQVELHDSSPPHSSPHKFCFMLGNTMWCKSNKHGAFLTPSKQSGTSERKVCCRSLTEQPDKPLRPWYNRQKHESCVCFHSTWEEERSSVPQFTATPYTSCPDVNTSCSTLYDFVGTYH